MAPATSNNILAIDIGDRRIGVAIADTTARLPRPLKTIINNPQVFDTIGQIVKDEQVAAIVVGLPRGMEGQETQQTKTTRAFAVQLQKQFTLPVHYQDEAMTSKLAEKELSASKKSYDKAMIDALAATYILEDFLNQHTGKDL